MEYAKETWNDWQWDHKRRWAGAPSDTLKWEHQKTWPVVTSKQKAVG